MFHNTKCPYPVSWGMPAYLTIIYNNCESHKTGVQKYPVNACGIRDGLSWNMLVLSQRNLVPLVLAPPTKNCFRRPDFLLLLIFPLQM